MSDPTTIIVKYILYLKDKIYGLSRDRKLDQKNKLLQSPFIPPQAKRLVLEEVCVVNANGRDLNSPQNLNDSQLSDLQTSFSDLTEQINQLNDSYCETKKENNTLKYNIETLKTKNKTLSKQLQEKKDLLASSSVRNANKRERRRDEKLDKLQKSCSELENLISKHEKEKKTFQKKLNRQKSNASYYKSQCTELKKTLKEKNQDL